MLLPRALFGWIPPVYYPSLRTSDGNDCYFSNHDYKVILFVTLKSPVIFHLTVTKLSCKYYKIFFVKKKRKPAPPYNLLFKITIRLLNK